MDKYNYYYIELKSGRYVYRSACTVSEIEDARKFKTKAQAAGYAKKYYDSSEFTVKGGGGIKKDEPYGY